MKGLATSAIEGKFSMRASITGMISMDEVQVPDDQRLPNVEGLKGPFGCLNKARYGIAWGAMGAAEFCWNAALDYTLGRKQFGKPLAANQLIQKKLADMQTEITLGLHAALRLGRLFDEGRAAPPAVCLLKTNNCRHVLESARLARRLPRRDGIGLELHVVGVPLHLPTGHYYDGTADI